MRRRRDGGQATVELVLVLPLVVALCLAIAQIAVLARVHILTVHAAREGARAAAVGGDARERALATSGLPVDVTTVDTSRDGDLVVVTVRTVDDTSVPLIGGLLGEVEVSATATMRIEE